jgi:hypothetical protein
MPDRSPGEAVAPFSNVPRYRDGFGKFETLNFMVPNDSVFLVTLFLPEMVIEADLPVPLTLAIY